MALSDRGPPAPGPVGTLPGDWYAAGQWTIVNGVLVLIPAPAGYYIPRGKQLSTLLTPCGCDPHALAEQLRQIWVSQSIARCLDDPDYIVIARDPERNRPPTVDDAIAILNNTRVLH